MKWRGGRRSSNIDDRRGKSGGGFRLPGRRGGMRLGRRGGGKRGGGIGIMGIMIMLGIAWMLGINPLTLLGGLSGGGGMMPAPQTRQAAPQRPISPERQDEMKAFVSVVLAETEDTWNALFKKAGKRYKEPKLVLFTGSVRSACGMASSASGPFYCPGDQQVYLDMSFFDEMSRKFGAKGDFAQAYVIAHEIGHHVQTLLGISDQVRRSKSGASTTKKNAIQVRMELQADCLAGIWAANADKRHGILEEGDIEEAMNAANAIGDDTLQKRSQGYVVPDSFTHGSSEQRVRWFKKGLKARSVNVCDSFSADRL